MKKEVMAYKSSKSPISEQFRTLRTNIQFMNMNKKMRVLHITSTFPNEGKSWVSSNLAVTFAQTGKKVILIDSDMRKGRQYAIFGVKPKPGLSNLLSLSEVDEEGRISENVLNYIQPTEVENLQIIVAGDVPPNPSELLVSAQMTGVLDELKKIFDIVIIDGTPSEIVTDSVILSRLADTTVIVTAHKITKKDALDRVVKSIQNVGGNIAGVILNKVPVSSKKYDSRYYYYGKDLSEKKNTKASQKDKVIKVKENFPNQIKKDNKKTKVRTDANSNKKEIKTEKSAVSKNNVKQKKSNLNGKNKNTQFREQNNGYFNHENKATSLGEQTDADKTLEQTSLILQQINDYLNKEKKEQ